MNVPDNDRPQDEEQAAPRPPVRADLCADLRTAQASASAAVSRLQLLARQATADLSPLRAFLKSGAGVAPALTPSPEFQSVAAALRERQQEIAHFWAGFRPVFADLGAGAGFRFHRLPDLTGLMARPRPAAPQILVNVYVNGQKENLPE